MQDVTYLNDTNKQLRVTNRKYVLVGTLYLGHRIEKIASIVMKIIDSEQSFRSRSWNRLCWGDSHRGVPGRVWSEDREAETRAGGAVAARRRR